MPVGLYNQPQARNAYQAAYENHYAANGQPKAALKPFHIDCGQKTSSVVSISEQGRQSAGIQTVEPKVLSAAEEAVYVEQLKNAYMEQCVSPGYNKHGSNYRSPGQVENIKNDIRQHDREATDWAYKKINAPEPCQTFELLMKKTSKQDDIVSDASTSISWFGINTKDFSEYYQRHADPTSVKIKEVSWQYTPYANGAKQRDVKLFYTKPATTPSQDNPIDISDEPVGKTPEFNNLRFGPMAHFEMHHQLKGGDFPAKRPKMPAILTIKYQYQTKSCLKPGIHDDL